MSIITSIKPQKQKSRVNIYLDGKFGFGIDLENFVKFGLKVEQELSEERIIEITKKAEFQKVFDRLLLFASLRPRSEKEINDWLKRKKVDESFTNTLSEKLRKLELLDDEKFAKWWVDQRIQFKFKSKRELVSELKIKGIENNIVNQILQESGLDEVGSAKKLLDKNIYKWAKFPKKIAHQKACMFLARKGFSWDIIRKAVDEARHLMTEN